MDKVFGVEITDGNDYYCLLDLPATDYELLDALERLHMKPNDKPRWEIIEHTDFQYLHVHLINECDLYQLNALANRLGQLDFCQKAAFEGLFNVEIYKKYGPISISTMIDLAYSTECCHVVEGVTTDAQLGEFYANNGFIPEVDALPDHLFKLLDFEKLGKKMRSEEGGIFTRQAYVTQHSELVQAYDKLILEPQRPEYAVLLHIGRYPFETDGLPDKMIPLELPVSEEQMMQALIECGAASWDEVIFQVEDSAIPGLLGDMDFNNIYQLNNLAMIIKQQKTQDDLAKLKAVLHAADCHDLLTAISIAESLDDFVHEPDQRTTEEVALDELRFTLDERSLSILQKHVDLCAYGSDLIVSNNATMTPYGVVQRKDGFPLQDIASNAPQMTMQ